MTRCPQEDSCLVFICSTRWLLRVLDLKWTSRWDRFSHTIAISPTFSLNCTHLLGWAGPCELIALVSWWPSLFHFELCLSSLTFSCLMWVWLRTCAFWVCLFCPNHCIPPSYSFCPTFSPLVLTWAKALAFADDQVLRTCESFVLLGVC